MSYLDLGYDKYLNRPVFKKKGQTILDTDSQIEGFVWDKGIGGNANLGGPNNDAGKMVVKDATGREKLIIDKDGLTIVGNAIIVKDAQGNKTTYSLQSG